MPTQTPPKIAPFTPDFVKGVCDVLAQTDHPGLTGSEIDSLLQMVGVRQREPGGNKRDSLYVTLYNVQVRQQAGNVVGGFIAKAMSPGRYAAQPARFDELRDQLNEFLVYYSYAVNEAGKLASGARASTISEGAALLGEVLDRHGDEHRVGGEQGGAVIGGGGRLKVQFAAVNLPDVGADAQGPVQRDGGEVVDGEAPGHCRGAGDPEAEAEQVVAGGGHCSAVREAGRTDVAFAERHIGVDLVAGAEHHQLQAGGIVWPAPHAGRRVRRQR